MLVNGFQLLTIVVKLTILDFLEVAETLLNDSEIRLILLLP